MAKYMGQTSLATFWAKILARIQSSVASLASAIPTDVSELTNNAGYQTAAQVQSAIATAVTGHYAKVLVDELPDIASADPNTEYLIPDPQNAAMREGYIAVNGEWVMTSNPAIDLSGYLQTSDVQELTTTDIDAVTDT
ncbi:MAG: hypothetical protein LBQ80_04135 [Clostridium sp.]|jgi:hypothetical protein|nr:hypothetical protein [Clostridium sp.]